MVAVTRIAYLAMLAVIVAAAFAVWTVISGSGGDDELPTVTTDQIVNYARFGLVDRVEADGRDLTVTFSDGLDTQEAFGDDAHTFRSRLGPGETITGLLQAAGVTIGTEGVAVTEP